MNSSSCFYGSGIGWVWLPVIILFSESLAKKERKKSNLLSDQLVQLAWFACITCKPGDDMFVDVDYVTTEIFCSHMLLLLPEFGGNPITYFLISWLVMKLASFANTAVFLTCLNISFAFLRCYHEILGQLLRRYENVNRKFCRHLRFLWLSVIILFSASKETKNFLKDK